jgi:hypothetical protein
VQVKIGTPMVKCLAKEDELEGPPINYMGDFNAAFSIE